MISLYSWNVNGIRAAQKNGFESWFGSIQGDFVCLQEIKATEDQLDLFLRQPKGYFSFWNPAQKPGYSGVATYTKREPLGVHMGLGVSELDTEGRVLTLEYDSWVMINAYFPNSQRDHARLPFKLKFCDQMMKYCKAWEKKGKQVVICGDFNIAHKEIDLRNPKTNVDNAGFLPQERKWLDSFTDGGFVDTFREFEPGGGHYSWWSYRPGVREKNVGWRIDYFFVGSKLKSRLKKAEIHPDVRGSDHCPVSVKIDLA